jgi:hypothetical protein
MKLKLKKIQISAKMQQTWYDAAAERETDEWCKAQNEDVESKLGKRGRIDRGWARLTSLKRHVGSVNSSIFEIVVYISFE